MSEEGYYSVKELANWILSYADSRGQKITNMSLNKLIYFAYEHALIKYGRKLSAAKIEAWDHGPVFREIYSEFKRFGAEPIETKATRYNTRTNCVEIVDPAVAQDDEEILIEAVKPLITLPAYILRELSHDSRGAWAAVWHHKNPSNPGMEISDDVIVASQPIASSVQ